MKIGIVTGSIREGRSAEPVRQWVTERAVARGDAEYVTLDLKEFDVPLLSSATVPGAAEKKYDDPRVQEWSAAVDACDGFVFITSEYNHSVPGVFKNAFDSLGNEWAKKPVAFVSYGAAEGLRAVEAWRLAIANFAMYGIRNQLSFSLVREFGENGLEPADHREGELTTMLDDLLEALS